jgi:hypothetical protein
VTFLAALNTGKPMRRPVEDFGWYRLDAHGGWLRVWITWQNERYPEENYTDPQFTRADFNATDWVCWEGATP